MDEVGVDGLATGTTHTVLFSVNTARLHASSREQSRPATGQLQRCTALCTDKETALQFSSMDRVKTDFRELNKSQKWYRQQLPDDYVSLTTKFGTGCTPGQFLLLSYLVRISCVMSTKT